MGFLIGTREVRVTPDGLIHLVDLVVAALGISRDDAVAEIRGMVKGGTFPDVKCFKREDSVLVTSGGAEDVLVRLVKMGRGFKGPVVMTMRCFMSQSGPFAPRIREGTVSIPVAEVCAEPPEEAVHDHPDSECQWGEEPQSNAEWSGRLLSDTEWAQTVFLERGEEGAADPPPVLNRHRTRLTDLELDQLEGATEIQAREAQREHFSKIIGWYRGLCEDAVIDEKAKGAFKKVLMDMLPPASRSWADRRARESWRRGVDESLA